MTKKEAKDPMEMSAEEILDELLVYSRQLGNKPSSSLLCNSDGSMSKLGIRAIKLQHLLAAHFEMELKDLLTKYHVLAPYLQGEVWGRFTDHLRAYHQQYMEHALSREINKAPGKEVS